MTLKDLILKYGLDTLPLHSSQQKIEEKSDDTHTVYRYRLVPTFDFKQGLLRLGPSVEVLEPKELRDEMVDDIRRMAGNYKILLLSAKTF